MSRKFFSAVMGFQNDTIEDEEAGVSIPVKNYPYPWLSHPVILAFIALSVIGNFCIFSLVCISKTFRRPSNYLVANLCVCSVYFITMFCHYNVRQTHVILLWDYNQFVCTALGVFQRLPLPVLPYTLLCISLDRSKAAKNPLEHTSSRSILAQISAIWIFGFIVVLPRSIINRYDPTVPGPYKCKKAILLGGHWSFQTLYAIFVLTVVYLVPTIILIKEFVTLRSKMRFLTLSQVEQRKRFQHRLRLMQNSCIFTAIFIICWLPQGIFQFPFDLPSEIMGKVGFMQTLVPFTDFSRQLALLNTCLNPILLILLSFDVREYLATCSLV